MDVQNTVSLIAGCINLALGALVFSRSLKNTVNGRYALVAISVALWCFVLIPFRSATDPDASLFWCKILYTIPIFIVTSFLFFNFTFVSERPSFKPIQLFSLIPAIGVLISVLWPQITMQKIIHPLSGEKQIIFGPGYPLYFVFIVTYFSWSFILLSRRYFTASGINLMQIRYVFFGTFISANLGMITNLVLPTLGIFALNWLGQILTIIMSGFIAYAIIRYRLMDIKLIIKRTIVYSMLLVMTFAIYVFVILSSQNTLGGKSGPTTQMFLTSLLVALGFEPLKRFFQRTTDRIFFKGEYDPKMLLSRLSGMMSNTIDLEKLCRDVTGTLADTLNAEKMAILLIGEEIPSVVVGAEQGFKESTLHWTYHDPLIEYFNVQGIQKELLIHNELKKHSEEDPSDQDLRALVGAMEAVGVALVGPIFTKGRLIGLFLLGAKRSEDIYTEDEFSLLEIIFSQAGTSIENARLYQRVQEQMEALKQNQSEQLMQSAKLASVGELAVSVAHEINNPLTGILGFTTLLLSETPPDDPRIKDLKVIESEALRSRQIVRNLLDFSRSHGSKKEPVDVNEVIRNTLILIRYQAKTSNFKILERYTKDLPFVYADSDQLKQVFINLIKNAFDAMPEGGLLRIQTSRAPGVLSSSQDRSLPTAATQANQNSPLPEMVTIQFKDSGMGINPDHLQRIFDPFFTTKGRHVGTGLGLSISYNIIEKHGGRLEVESKVNHGSNFIVKLPLHAYSGNGRRNG